MKYNMINECIGNYFKDRRIANKYSMQFCADKIGVSKSTYFNYEAGAISMPHEHIKTLLNLYNDDGNKLISIMQTTFQNFLVQFYATIHGYNVTSSEDYEKEKVG